MRSGDALRRDVLRMASNAIYLSEKRQGKPLDEAEEIAIVSREVKTRRESVEAYQSAGRTEFLPAALSEDELGALVTEAIAATGATSPRDLGKVMGWLSPRTRGRADGKVLSGLVASRLTAADLATHDAAASH